MAKAKKATTEAKVTEVVETVAPAAETVAAPAAEAAPAKAPAKKATKAAPKTTAKAAAPKKACAKPAAKKAATAEMTTKVVIEISEKSATTDALIERAKEDWTSKGNALDDMKALSLYINAAEGMVYYVVNDDYLSGSFAI